VGARDSTRERERVRERASEGGGGGSIAKEGERTEDRETGQQQKLIEGASARIILGGSVQKVQNQWLCVSEPAQELKRARARNDEQG